MTIENERFEQIMAVVLANLAPDFTAFAKWVDPMEDVSDACGSTGCLLAGAKVSSHELDDFVAEFTARYQLGAVSPAIAKIQAANDELIQQVIDDVLARASKYGFVPTEDTGRDLIRESSSLLNIALRPDMVDRGAKMLVEQYQHTLQAAPSIGC